MYRQDFLKAIKRTNELGYTSDPCDLSEKRYLNEHSIMGIGALLGTALNIDNYDKLYRTCIPIHYKLQPYVNELLGVEATLTLGSLKVYDHYFFKMDEQEITSLVAQSKVTFNLHAWLTLPSMEIIDVTFNTTYGVHNDIQECLGGLITKHPDDLILEMSYEPVLIGERDLIKPFV